MPSIGDCAGSTVRAGTTAAWGACCLGARRPSQSRRHSIAPLPTLPADRTGTHVTLPRALPPTSQLQVRPPEPREAQDTQCQSELTPHPAEPANPSREAWCQFSSLVALCVHGGLHWLAAVHPSVAPPFLRVTKQTQRAPEGRNPCQLSKRPTPDEAGPTTRPDLPLSLPAEASNPGLVLPSLDR